MSTVSGLVGLARRQHQVADRAQLGRLGVGPGHIRHQVLAGRWQVPVRNVVVLHNGPLLHAARLWIAALAAGSDGALCSWTALGLSGIQGWERPEIHLVVPRGSKPLTLAGTVVHESRRHHPSDIARLDGLPVHPCARAAVDAAVWSRSARTAVGVLAAVVQQGLTTPSALHEELVKAGRVRHRRTLQLALGDIAGGAHSLAEIDFGHLCREAGLPEPDRQVRRRDARGRWRYLDVEWRLSDGRRLIVEVDGIGHMEQGRWYDDLLRTAELPVADGQVLIRLPSLAFRTERSRVVAILRRHLPAAA